MKGFYGEIILGKWKRVWKSSETIATNFLEEMGFRVLSLHERIMINNVEVGEVDIIAEKNGVKYAVEVKAGSLDVSGVRQAFVNAQLIGAKPLVIARGIDDRAKTLAEKLGLEIIILPDIIIASTDDIREIMRESLYSIIDELASVLISCNTLSEKDYSIIREIANSETIKDASKRLGLSVEDLSREISKLVKKGILPRGSYRLMRLIAKLLTYCSILKNKNTVPRP